MPSSVAQAQTALQLLKQVNTLLETCSFPHAGLAQTMDKARTACASSLTSDFISASDSKIEDLLWLTHVKINTYFRTQLRKVNESRDVKSLERRKLVSDFFKFIKRSADFYQSLIRALDHVCGGIAEMRQLAGKFKKSNKGAAQASDSTHVADAENPLKVKVLGSVHRTLIHLGDLYRYQALEVAERTMDLKPAFGFYDLARCILPSIGVAYNQMAIVALADDNHLDATYYLFRSLVVVDAHSQAQVNLRKAYLKITAAWNNGELMQRASDLVAWYLRLISKCSRGMVFPEHSQIAENVSTLLQAELDTASTESTFQKIFMINFAACYLAQEQFTTQPAVAESFQAFIYHLEITLTSIRDLITVLNEQLSVLRRSLVDGQLQGELPMAFKKNLPLLCMSMLWANKNIRILTNAVSPGVDSLSAAVWQQFAVLLSHSLVVFGIEGLPASSAPLQEDEETVAFMPLTNSTVRPRRVLECSAGDNTLDFGGDTEARCRLRSIVKAGMEFALDEQIPLRYDAKLGIFCCDIPNAGTSDQMQVDSEKPEELADSAPVEAVEAVETVEPVKSPASSTPETASPPETPIITKSIAELVWEDTDRYGLPRYSGSAGMAGMARCFDFRLNTDSRPNWALRRDSPPRPGSGSRAEAAFNAASPAISAGTSVASNSSPVARPTAGTVRRPSNGNYPSTSGATTDAMGLGNGTFGEQIWGNSPSSSHGATLFFQPGYAPRAMSSAELKHMNALPNGPLRQTSIGTGQPSSSSSAANSSPARRRRCSPV